jgi:hypothetical protein
VLKLLAMLVTFLVVGLMLLGLRQRRLELTAESARLYEHIRGQNETLLGQEVTIAGISNPWALKDALQKSGVNTGGALERRRTTVGRAVPAIETDLTAPIR